VERSLLSILSIPDTTEDLFSKVSKMTFTFYCHECGSILYEDSRPVLHDGTFRKETYLQSIISRIGGKCPYCKRKLNFVPLRIEVDAPSQSSVQKERETMKFASYCGGGGSGKVVSSAAVCVGSRDVLRK
jgi:uncharacterized protein YbaR (Trm112 family)